MKNKPIMLLFALILCMGVFVFPITAHAATDTTPPTISASLSGQVLHVEAADADSGVEAVFIDNNRVNYRVDSSLDVVLKDYAGTGEYVSIYAMDFAGNKSKVVQIKNPFYVAPKPTSTSPTSGSSQPTTTPEPTEAPSESQVPEEPREPNPFTPDGTGTVQDNATDGDGKEFFTIVTPDENVFYLIIDRQRDSENVYLLNTVTEEDLAALADKSGSNSGQSAVPTPEPNPQPTDPTPTPEPEPEPEPEPAKSNTGTVIFIIIAALAAGGAGYYFKVLKPKQNAQGSSEFDDDDDSDFDFDEDYGDSPDDEDDYYIPDEDELSDDPLPDFEDEE